MLSFHRMEKLSYCFLCPPEVPSIHMTYAGHQSGKKLWDEVSVFSNFILLPGGICASSKRLVYFSKLPLYKQTSLLHWDLCGKVNLNKHTTTRGSMWAWVYMEIQGEIDTIVAMTNKGMAILMLTYYRCNNYVYRKVCFCVSAWTWRHWHSHQNV